MSEPVGIGERCDRYFGCGWLIKGSNAPGHLTTKVENGQDVPMWLCDICWKRRAESIQEIRKWYRDTQDW